MNNIGIGMIVHNEEKRLSKLLPYLHKYGIPIYCLVQYSSDRTYEICDEYGLPYVYPHYGYSEISRHDLFEYMDVDNVLYIDADEVPSEALMEFVVNCDFEYDVYPIEFRGNGESRFQHYRLFNKHCVEYMPWMHTSFYPLKGSKVFSSPIQHITHVHTAEEVEIAKQEMGDLVDSGKWITPAYVLKHLGREPVTSFKPSFSHEIAKKFSSMFGNYASVLYLGNEDGRWQHVFNSECLYCHGYCDYPNIVETSKSCLYSDVKLYNNSYYHMYDWSFSEYEYLNPILLERHSKIGFVCRNPNFLSSKFHRNKILENIVSVKGFCVYSI